MPDNPKEKALLIIQQALEVSKCSKGTVRLNTQIGRVWLLCDPGGSGCFQHTPSAWLCLSSADGVTHSLSQTQRGAWSTGEPQGYFTPTILGFSCSSPAEIKVFPYLSLSSDSSEQFVSFSSGNLQICHPLRIRWVICSLLPGAQTALARCFAVLCSSKLDHHYLLWGNANITPLVSPVAPGEEIIKARFFFFPEKMNCNSELSSSLPFFFILFIFPGKKMEIFHLW